MKKILNKIFVVSGLCAALSSCSFLDVEPQVICSDTFYNTEKEVLYGLAGVYGVMSNEALYGNYYSLMTSAISTEIRAATFFSSTDILPVHRRSMIFGWNFTRV